MPISEQIDHDIKDAMRAKEAAKLTVLRMLKSSLKNRAIEQGGADTVLGDEEAITVIRKELKKRQDSFESFEKGGRPELAAKEREESLILEAYLPKALDPAELEALVKAAIAETGATSKAQMGQVMKAANAKAEGRADGRALSSMVQKLLP